MRVGPTSGETFLDSEISQGAFKYEFALAMGLLQGFEEDPAKVSREHPDRKEEPRAAGDPPLAGGVEAATGYDAVKVGMKAEGLSPGVQHRHKSKLGAKMFWVLRDRAQGPCCGLEQNVVEEALVLQADSGNLLRDGEDDMEILERMR